MRSDARSGPGIDDVLLQSRHIETPNAISTAFDSVRLRPGHSPKGVSSISEFVAAPLREPEYQMRNLTDIAGAYMVPDPRRKRSLEEMPAEKFDGNFELLRTAIALVLLDPDDDDAAWSARRVAPLAFLATWHTFEASELRWLAQHWGCGALRGRPSLKWTQPDALTGRSRAQTFASEWNILVGTRATEYPASMALLFGDAEEALKQLRAPLPTLHLEDPEWKVCADLPAAYALLH